MEYFVKIINYKAAHYADSSVLVLPHYSTFEIFVSELCLKRRQPVLFPYFKNPNFTLT